MAASIGNQMMKVQFIDYAGDFLYEVNIPRGNGVGSPFADEYCSTAGR